MRATVTRKRAPRVPHGLDGYARQAWVQLARVLTDANILTRLDSIALEAMCRCYGMWRTLLDRYEAQDRPAGLEAPLRDWHALLLDYMRDFFLTPKSRATAFTRDPLEGIGRPPTKKGA